MTLPARWDVPEPLAVCEVPATDGASIFVRRHGNPNGPRFVLSHGNGFSIDAYMDLFTRTTLRRTADGTGYELRCPREYEAQVYDYVYCWSMTVDLDSVPGPIKAIGADPIVPHSYMPSIDVSELQLLDYDFIPETTHLLLLEKPDACADLALDFLESHGLV